MDVQILPTDQTEKILLQSEHAELVKLNSLWAERTAALVFVRHFG